MKPLIMDLKTRRELVGAHLAEAVDNGWSVEFSERCINAIMAIDDGTDLTKLPVADEADAFTLRTTDEEIVGTLIDYHW